MFRKLGLLLLCLTLFLGGVSVLGQDEAVGTITETGFESATLEREYEYLVYLPAGYETSGMRYPVAYLLHGRGDEMTAWLNVQDLLDDMIAAGEIPPLIAIMPDFPSSRRGNYYIDAEYTSVDLPSEPVETAFINDLIPHVDKTYRTIPTREGRLVGGYSMGGYGAIRYSLAYPDLFSAALVLSPAVYTPLPPVDSSARLFGAFGVGDNPFDEERYQSLNYPALFEDFAAAELPLYLFIAVGDDEWKHPAEEDQYHDLDFESHLLYNRARRVPYIVPELRVYDGEHDWTFWRVGFAEGMRTLGRFLASPE